MAAFEMSMEEDAPIPMETSSSVTSEESTNSNYVAKCGNHESCLSRLTTTDPLDSASAAEVAAVEVVAKHHHLQQHPHLHPGNLKCKCSDPACSFKRYFRDQRRRLLKEQQQQQQKLREEEEENQKNDLNGGGGGGGGRPKSSSSSSSSPLVIQTLETVKAELHSVIGSRKIAEDIYKNCLNLSKKEAGVFSTTASDEGDTVLMELCFSEEKSNKTLLYGQILAFIRLYDQQNPELLFVRNTQGFSALDLAALTNKIPVAKYLALLYKAHGRDVNECNGAGKHSVLHRLARKGDDVAETLRELLKLRNSETGERLFRLDVVNTGRKTPLDVAVACKELFSTGKERTIYNQTLEIFHAVIEEDTRELLGLTSAVPALSPSLSPLRPSSPPQTSSSLLQWESKLTYRNKF